LIDWWLIFGIANTDVSDKRRHKGMLNLTKVRFETHDWVVDWLNRRGGIPQARGRMPTDMTCLNSEWVVDRLKIIEEGFPRWEMVVVEIANTDVSDKRWMPQVHDETEQSQIRTRERVMMVKIAEEIFSGRKSCMQLLN
jgi:hypothetical protein